MTFKDHFSDKSKQYVRSRPTYPMALYEYLAELAPGQELAWDCATGNGQAAIGLAEFFEQVIATDASEEQITHAIPHDKVNYRVAHAEKSGLPNQSVELVAVGTALHWFQLEAFYKEVNRVLKPGGLLAAWGYGFISSPPEIAELFNRFAGETMEPYWPQEAINNWKDKYQSIELPYPMMDVPAFTASMDWTLEDLQNFVLSWSAVTQYEKQHGQLPTGQVFRELEQRWGDAEQVRTIEWPLHMVIGRKPE